MAEDDETDRVKLLRHSAQIARAQAAQRGPAWSAYELMMSIAAEMEAEARALSVDGKG